MTVPMVTATLSAADRCDRCGAQAYVQAEFMNGTLLFCAHHGRKFQAPIKKQATAIMDESGKL